MEATQKELDYYFKAYDIDRKQVPTAQQEGIRKLISRIIELYREIQNTEERNVPVYCPTCTSCGEEGCCSPDACVAVKCLYEKTNLRSYEEAQSENAILWDFVDAMQKLGDANLSASTLANNTEKRIQEMWSEKWPDKKYPKS